MIPLFPAPDTIQTFTCDLEGGQERLLSWISGEKVAIKLQHHSHRKGQNTQSPFQLHHHFTVTQDIHSNFHLPGLGPDILTCTKPKQSLCSGTRDIPQALPQLMDSSILSLFISTMQNCWPVGLLTMHDSFPALPVTPQSMLQHVQLPWSHHPHHAGGLVAFKAHHGPYLGIWLQVVFIKMLCFHSQEWNIYSVCSILPHEIELIMIKWIVVDLLGHTGPFSAQTLTRVSASLFSKQAPSKMPMLSHLQ